MAAKMQTAERVSQTDSSDNYVFQRSLLAYYHAAKLVSGTVLEIGTGSGYGINVIAPSATRFMTIDKFETKIDTSDMDNVEFRQMTVPPIDLPSSSVDFVISKCSVCIGWRVASSSLTGRNVPAPTCNVTSSKPKPLPRICSISSGVKCRPAVGAATDPSNLE